MGVLDDLRRDITRAIEEARREATGTQTFTAPPVAKRGSDGRLTRQSLQRVPPAGSTGLTRQQPSSAGAPALDFDLSVPAAPLIPPRENRPLATAASTEAEATGSGFTVTPHDIVRAILLGEVLDEPKGRRARRPHPK